MREFKTILNLLKKDKWKLLLAFICILISGLSTLLTGYLQGESVENIVELNLEKAILYLIIYFLNLLILNTILRGFGKLLANKVENNLSRKISILAYKKTLNLPSYAFEEKTSGEFINRIINDANSLNNSINSLTSSFISVVSCILIFIYVLYNSYIIGLEIVIFILIISIIMKIFNPKIKKINEELKGYQDSYASIATESLRGIREIKTLGIKNNLTKEVEQIRKIIFEKSNKERTIDTVYTVLMYFIKLLMEVTVFLTCLIGIYQGKIELGFFIAMTWYIYQFTWLIETFTELNSWYQQMMVSLKRVNEIIGNKLYEDVTFGAVNLNKVYGEIKLDNVTFAYPNEANTLKNLSVTFEPHKKIAIVVNQVKVKQPYSIF